MLPTFSGDMMKILILIFFLGFLTILQCLYNVYDQKKINLDQDTLFFSGNIPGKLIKNMSTIILKSPNGRPPIICISSLLVMSSNQDNTTARQHHLFQDKRR